jgi:serine/threonine-protein kinase
MCGKTWPADHSICPDDGTWLYEQTIIELQPKSRRPSLEFAVPDTTTGRQHRYESTTRAQRYETPAQAMPLRGASTDVIAAQLAPDNGLVEIIPGMPIGEYEVEAKIGEGAMGTVYRAIHPQIGKHVAIKVMTPTVFGEAEAVKRFVGEARAVAAIEHPGIVDVFGFGRIPDGRTYLVMEWLEGESLSARIDKGELPELEVYEIIRQIARALEAAHAKGIIHRDLKPENVFLKKVDNERPTVKLLDFGLAKSTNKDDVANVAKTRSGQMLGTPLYMSPEQCKNKGVDQRTDIYALGCMCFELLVGRTPYDADNVAEIITAHLVGEPPRPSKFNPGIDPDLDKLLFGMIQKDPERRPPLGEIRRIMGMQLSRLGFHANTPIDGFAPIASSPFIASLVTPGPAPVVADPTPAPMPDVSMTDAEMLNAIRRGGPAWYVYAAVAVVIVIVALILVL